MKLPIGSILGKPDFNTGARGTAQQRAEDVQPAI